jgi:IS5 family transposase
MTRRSSNEQTRSIQQAIRELLDNFVVLAYYPKVTRGRELRTNGTVIESNIHHTANSSLLVDAERMLRHTLHRAHPIVNATADQARQTVKDQFPNLWRSACNRAETISAVSGRRMKEIDARCRHAYKKLVKTT